MAAARRATLSLLLVAALAAPGAAQALFPPVVANSALERPIVASAVCGRPPRTDCAAGGTEACFACNATCPQLAGAVLPPALGTMPQPECACAVAGCQRLNADAHPAQYANDNSSVTYFQSPDNIERVNITVDLLWEQEVQVRVGVCLFVCLFVWLWVALPLFQEPCCCVCSSCCLCSTCVDLYRCFHAISSPSSSSSSSSSLAFRKSR